MIIRYYMNVRSSQALVLACNNASVCVEQYAVATRFILTYDKIMISSQTERATYVYIDLTIRTDRNYTAIVRLM
jgi:hypothetical protein